MSNHPNWRTHIFQRGGPTTNQRSSRCCFLWWRFFPWSFGLCELGWISKRRLSGACGATAIFSYFQGSSMFFKVTIPGGCFVLSQSLHVWEASKPLQARLKINLFWFSPWQPRLKSTEEKIDKPVSLKSKEEKILQRSIKCVGKCKRRSCNAASHALASARKDLIT